MPRSIRILYLIHVVLLINGITPLTIANTGFSTHFIISDSSISLPIVPDSLKTQKSSGLDKIVEYNATDSMRFDIREQKVYLFGEAQVLYDGIALKAAYIELNLESKELWAQGTTDSLGKLKGTPVFEDGGQSFTSETMRYNFETKKGKIIKAITQEGDGYIHGEQVKMATEDVLYIKNGKYTTCSNVAPHFHIEASKLKFIKDDKIVTGPAYLVIEKIPTPLAVPFGFFPNKEKQTSGIIIPTYGESPGLGYFLNSGGYYWAVNDFLDLAITGDIYSRGSWGVNANSNYRKRYKYNGYLDLSYSKLNSGEKDINRSQKTNYFIRWQHAQDAKARPNSDFSADLNFGSTKNFQNNFNSNTQDFLSNTFKSNVTYNRSWAGKPLNFTLNGNHNQNSLDSSVTVTLPDATFTLSSIYPFKRKAPSGESKWYENIGIAYAGVAQNRVSTSEKIFTEYPDSLFKLMKNGMRHSVPLTSSFKFLKHFSVNPVFNYTERWYLESVQKSWDYAVTRNATGELVKDTVKTEIDTYVPGFVRSSDYGMSASLKTTLYGMYQYKLKHLKAIRHVMYPSANVNLKPDFSQSKFGYYRTYTKTTETDTTDVEYSKFDGQLFGGPTGKAQSGTIGMSLFNTLEAKVLSRRDTTGTVKKVKLLDNFNLSSNYSIFSDSLNWTPVDIYIKSRVHKNVDVQVNSKMDPYAFVTDSNGVSRTINTSQWKANSGLARLTNLDFVLSFNLKSKAKKENKTLQTAKNDTEMVQQNPNDFVDFTAPWTLNVSYRFTYIKPYDIYTVTNTLNFNGDVSITPKWKVGYSSGYDMATKKFTYTSFNVYRDLHCWELVFNVVPFGSRKSYSVDLRVKSPILQDLKLSRKRNWYDYE